jgi:putative peptide zinc metalloprotease protein
MFICSVNTILFNANPLLRYDGYYVMADWLEVPNLRIKSTQFFSYAFQEKVLGLEIPVQSYMPKSRRYLFVTYAIASYLYRWVVTFSILFFLSQFLKPYGLQSISYALALGSLVPLLFMPLYQAGKFIYQPGRMRKVKKARTAAFFAVTGLIVAGILLIPTPLRVTGTLVLRATKPQMVYAEVPGRLVDIKVRDGDEVKAGQLLATLSNPEKLRERTELQEQHDINQLKAEVYDRSMIVADRALSQAHLDQALAIDPAIDRVNQQIGSLNLVAGRDGRAMGVPNRETIGQFLRPDKPFCEVADPRVMEAHLILDQSDIDLVRSDKRAWIKIYGSSEETIRTRVAEIAKRNRDDVPPELSNLAGGEIATKPDKQTGQVKPLNSVYEVILPVDNSMLHYHPGQRGFAKIDGGHSSLGWWIWRMLTKTFHFTL